MKPDGGFGGIYGIEKIAAKGRDTMPGKQHEIWFHEKLVNKGDTSDFRIDRAEDWTRLQVLDGNTFKPAMDQGFSGMPSSEQMGNLYKLAEQGKLIYFGLGQETPFAVTTEGVTKINMNPVEPTKPVDPGEKATNEQKILYRRMRDQYPRRYEIYEAAVAVLENLGEGFHEALESYNSARNMGVEQKEGESRKATSRYVHELHRLENTDRLIDDAFGPRPVASPGYFFDTVQNGNNDFVFSYETFDRQFAPNGYDLPEDSKLTAQEVATINFAMTGASEFVCNFYKEQLHAGENYAKNDATNGFQMLVTGCFGQQRVAQVLSKMGVLNETFKLGKEVVAQYNSGNPELLGKNLADCVRNIKAVCAGHSWTSVSHDMVAGARVIGRIQELFDKHGDIKQAANLTEKEQQFMRGYVQLGKAFEQHLKNMVKFNDSVVHGKALTIDEKAEILADAVLRRLVEKDFIADKELEDQVPEYRKQYDAAIERDSADRQRRTEWLAEHPTASPAEEAQYMMENDLGIHSTLLSARDLDHGTIFALAKDGMLEKMRSELIQNPAIREAAAKEPFEFSSDDLEKSEKLDTLAAQAEATNKLWKAQVWYENLEATLVGSRSENWLNPNTPGDNNRLMVGVMETNVKTGVMEGKLIGLDAILQGGVKALENPSQETINILYEQAAKGNLYFYDVGKDMPVRVGAENARSTAEQLKVPPQPTLWQKIANFLTFGWAYADICNPKPDKDPAVFKAILAARESRSAATQNEAKQPAQENKQVEKKPEQTVEREQKQNQKEDMIHDQMLGRKLAEYNKQKVDAAIGRFAIADEKYMPAGDKNTMGLTKEEVGVLAAIACGSAELSFEDAKSGIIAHNKPDEYYSRIISTHYAEGQQLASKGAKSFHALARREVKNALESGDMEKLGKLLADGLTQNNKWLAKQTDLSDYYTVYAELGGKLLNIVDKNEPLKQAFNKHLGENTNQINMAKAAKNISDLRVKVLPLKEQLMKDFTKYENGAKDKPLHVSTNEEIATICQLCMIQHCMKTNDFDLATTKYSKPNTVNKLNDFLKDSKQLDIFRNKTDYREDCLDDVFRMATLYSDAINIKKAEMAEQKQAQIVADKQNEKQIEQPKLSPM